MIRSSLLPLLASASIVSALEVDISGNFTADAGTRLDAAWSAHNTVNQDINLTIGAEFDEKTSVELFLTNSSFVTDSNGNARVSVVRSVEDGRSAPISDPDSRWGSILYDGILFQWEFSRMASLLVGDLAWFGGNTNYYGYSWAQEYGSIMKETTVRGAGVKLGEEGEFFLGMPDANDRAVWGYASYRFLLTDKADEKWSVRPLGDIVFKNGGRHRQFTFGTETEYMRSKENMEYSFHGAYGALPYHGKTTHTFLAEPSMSYGDFSLGGSFYNAILARKDSLVTQQTDIPEQMFAAIEPGYSILPKVAVGVSGEWHNPSLEVSADDYFAVVPTVYLYPSDQMSFTFWSKYQWMWNAGDLFSVGAVAQVEF